MDDIICSFYEDDDYKMEVEILTEYNKLMQGYYNSEKGPVEL